MNSIAVWVGAISLVVMAGSYPQKSAAEGFTGAEFLQWSMKQQTSYLETQLVMAGSIAARIDPALSQCLSNHFLANEGGISADRFEEILENVRDFSEFHPSSVLVVTMESACGSF